jgi:hypothetical protein
MRNKEKMNQLAERKARELTDLAHLDEEGQKAYLEDMKRKPEAKPKTGLHQKDLQLF